MNSSELIKVFLTCRSTLISVAIVSGIVNLLYLTGSFFMLEVYDRVLPSRSIPTLVGLMGLAIVLYIFQGILEALRSRILARVGATLDEALGVRVFDLVARAPLQGISLGDGLLPLRDLDTLRGFLSGAGPSALFDLPWLPLYIVICAMFHPLIGIAAAFGAIVLASLTALVDAMTRAPSRGLTNFSVERNSLAEVVRRNSEVLTALGMHDRFTARWAGANARYLSAQMAVSDIASGLGAFSKVFRMTLQSGVLALGAYLVVKGEATSGIIIASSILVSRALAPAELAIANWKGFVAARQSWKRLEILFKRLPVSSQRHMLPAPSRKLDVEAICVSPPGGAKFVIQHISFQLTAGQGMGVIGPSAAGKSTLVRSLVGIWPAAQGKVRLDGAALDQWTAADLGHHIGYLPQEIELFAGTVAENIARFDPNHDDAVVIKAAEAAGVHEMVLRLPEGYSTVLGVGGVGLSAGQRQRIGLARALYGDPFLVVLDEPNANLDQEGEAALTLAVGRVRQRGGIVIVVAHRPSALASVDLLLVMANGRAQAFGPKDEVLKHSIRPAGVSIVPGATPRGLQERA